ncbi:MAG: hypothetical protein IH944_04660 [Armatimonadetes bacterium]|nr:hypothetical protein [Armatimonadota bacterium]
MITEKRDMSALDAAILEAFVRRLPPSLGDIAQDQISAITRVAHKPADQWIGLVLGRRSARSELPMFPNRYPSSTAAFVFGASGGNDYRANIVVNCGLLDSIALSEPPGDLPTDVSAENFEVVLVNDLDTPGENPEAIPIDQLESAQARSFSESHHATEFFPPKSQEIVDAYQRFLGSPLPADFLQLVEHVDGFKTEHWDFLGVSGRIMVWPTRECIKSIAEDDECLFGICFVADDREGRYYLLSEVDADLQPLETDLRGALVELESHLKDYHADIAGEE